MLMSWAETYIHTNCYVSYMYVISSIYVVKRCTVYFHRVVRARRERKARRVRRRRRRGRRKGRRAKAKEMR